MSQDPDYIQEFVAECREGMDRIDNVLVALEKNPGDLSGLDSVFRVLHTIKGNAGFLDFPQLGSIAHAGEALLSKLCGVERKVSPEVCDSLLRMLDALRIVVGEIDATSKEGNSDHAALKLELGQFVAAAEYASQPETVELESSPQVRAVVLPPVEGEKSELPKVPKMKKRLPRASREAPGSHHSTFYIPPSSSLPDDPPAEPLTDNPSPAAVSSVVQDDSWSMSAIGTKSSERELSTFLRVKIDYLDELMNLVGELVLARNHLVQVTSGRSPDDALTEPIQRLNRLTAAIQDGVMRTRMQPVRNAWAKYPRIVRDLAKNCGKLCELELQGGDTELDKSMLESISDPLVHLVRNAIDHGIEKPYLRRIKGKPETGRLLVRAFQESGQVHVEVSDDGAGLDLERIRQKSIDVGLVSRDNAQLISENDLQNSVFLPGFSTAERVTSLSGRGVGMDVVKSCVEQIGGTIELKTRKDVGTTIRLTVPLTLAIIPAIMVSCGHQRFAIPQINVVEMLRLRGEEKHRACEQFHATPVLRFRDELLPMADLGNKLRIDSLSGSMNREFYDIVVLKTGTRRFALLVDEIGNAQEIVVKPLGALLTCQTEYSGAALMGDGSIALIIDVLGIARTMGLLTDEQTPLSDSATLREEVPKLEEQVLLCQIEGDRQIALPLSNVVCLEKVPFTSVEHSAAGDVMQYRGEILPLYSFSGQRRTPRNGQPEFDQISVVVYRNAGMQRGLLVENIIDVVSLPKNLVPVELATEPNSIHRVTATAVVLGRITDFLQIN